MDAHAKVLRIDPSVAKPVRPDALFNRFVSPHNFLLKDQYGKQLSSSCYAWIVKRYLETKGLNSMARNLREGLLKEIKSNEQQSA